MDSYIFVCHVAVRYGRVPKRSRERGGSAGGNSLGSLEDPGTSQSPGGFADPSTPDSSDGQQQQIQQQQQQQQAIPAQRDPCESRQLAIYDTILTVSQAHHAHCAYTEEKIRNLVRTPVILVSFSHFNLIYIIF